MPASATEIRVMSGGAPKEAFAVLVPKFEQQTGKKVVFIYDVLTALREKIAAGEKADVLVMPDGALLVSDDKAGRIYRISYGSGN